MSGGYVPNPDKVGGKTNRYRTLCLDCPPDARGPFMYDRRDAAFDNASNHLLRSGHTITVEKLSLIMLGRFEPSKVSPDSA